MDDASVEKIINTNLTSMMLGTRFLLRNGYLRAPKTSKAEEEMEGEKGKKAFSPVIINVSSLLGIKGGYGAVAYAASKAGVLGFTRALATEYASHKVRVNAVVPGYVETEMTKGMCVDVFKNSFLRRMGWANERICLDLNTSEIQQRIPLGRFGKTEEIAHAALFLAENEYAHNCIVNLDGGLSAV
jgi:NAD(P)-dependent dehydrogenase (short-subunit alcohol dehydrogenase family)